MFNKFASNKSSDERNEHYYGYCNVIDSYLKKRTYIDSHFAFLPIDIIYTPDILTIIDNITDEGRQNTLLFLQHYLIKTLPYIYKNMEKGQDITVIFEMQKNSFFCNIEYNHPVILHLKKQSNNSKIEIYLDDVLHSSLYKKIELAIKNIIENSLIKPFEIIFYPKYKTDEELQVGYKTLYNKNFFRNQYINPIQNFVGRHNCMIQTLYLLKKWLKNPEIMRLSIQKNHDGKYLLDYSAPEIMFRANNIKNITTYFKVYQEESQKKIFKNQLSLQDLITHEYLSSHSTILKKIFIPLIKNYILTHQTNLLSEIRTVYADKLRMASDEECYLYIEKRLLHSIGNIKKALENDFNKEQDNRLIVISYTINELLMLQKEKNYQISQDVRNDLKRLGVGFSSKPKKNLTHKLIDNKINHLKKIRNKYLKKLALSFELKHLKKIMELNSHVKEDYQLMKNGNIEKSPQYIKFFKKNYTIFYENCCPDKKEALLQKYDVRQVLRFDTEEQFDFEHLLQWLTEGKYKDNLLYARAFSYFFPYFFLRSSQIDKLIDICFQKKLPILILSLVENQLINLEDFDVIKYERTFSQIMYEKYSECSNLGITLTSLLLWIDQNNLDHFLNYYNNLDNSKKEILLEDMVLYLSTVSELDSISSKLFYRIIMVIHQENYIEKDKLAFFLDEILKKCIENERLDLQSYLYDMIQSKNVEVLNLNPIKQTGHNCKVTALACLDNFWGQQLKFNYIPVHKSQSANRGLFLSEHSLSMRYISKLFGSRQGELLEINQMTGILESIGYQSQIIFCNYKEEMHQLIKEKILNNEPVIGFIAINPQYGYPISSYIPGTEHACIISGYHEILPLIRITHQNKHHWVSIDLLFKSNLCLPKNREKEHYMNIKPLNPKKKYELLDFLSNTTNKPNDRISITPTSNSGFKGKLIVVKRPVLEIIKNKRDTLPAPVNLTESSFPINFDN